MVYAVAVPPAPSVFLIALLAILDSQLAQHVTQVITYLTIFVVNVLGRLALVGATVRLALLGHAALAHQDTPFPENLVYLVLPLAHHALVTVMHVLAQLVHHAQADII